MTHLIATPSADMARVAGKIALITGASSGLGKADAWRLAEEGATVILSDVDDAGAAIAEEIAGTTGQTTRFFTQDVSDEKRWEQVVNSVTEEFGGAGRTGKQCRDCLHRVT